MDHFKVPTFDQMLLVNDRVLLSSHNNQTLAELEIEPNTVITLRVSFLFFLLPFFELKRRKVTPEQPSQASDVSLSSFSF